MLLVPNARCWLIHKNSVQIIRGPRQTGRCCANTAAYAKNRIGNEIDKRVSQPDSAGRSIFAKVDEMTLDGVYSEVSQTLVEEEGKEENRTDLCFSVVSTTSQP